jgi:Zn-finger in ubiquitin-hydrolases and other protein
MRLAKQVRNCPADVGLRLKVVPQAHPPVGTHLMISGQEETLPDPASLKGETPTKIINVFLRRMWTGQFRSKPCSHVYLARPDISPASQVCGKCVALGDSWPALRMCLLCGYVGCCDKSNNTHAREHFRQTGHPLTRPYKERVWTGCGVTSTRCFSTRYDQGLVAGTYF